jgi:hypothetical protein
MIQEIVVNVLQIRLMEINVNIFVLIFVIQYLMGLYAIKKMVLVLEVAYLQVIFLMRNALIVQIIITIEVGVVLNFVLKIAMEYVIKIMDFVLNVKMVFIRINVMKDVIKHFAKVVANKIQVNAMIVTALFIIIKLNLVDALDVLLIVLNVQML